MTPREQAYDRIAAVRRACDEAEGAWGGALVTLTSVFGISGAKQQALGAIRSIRATVEEGWGPRAQLLAPDDAAGWQRWVNDGNDLLHNLNGEVQNARFNDLEAIVVETAAATVAEVKADAVAVGKAAVGALPWVTVLAVVLVGGFVFYRLRG